jgi:hypothetical protein
LRRQGKVVETNVPGVFFLEIDGLAGRFMIVSLKSVFAFWA